MEKNSVKFSPKRKITKLSQEFEIMQSDALSPKITYQKAVNPIYNKFYDKLDNIICSFVKSERRDNISFIVTFANEKYVSGIIKNSEFGIPINFDVEKGLFQNDRQVMKSLKISKKEIKRAVFKVSGNVFIQSPCLYRFENGIGVCVRTINAEEKWCTVKIRQ